MLRDVDQATLSMEEWKRENGKACEAPKRNWKAWYVLEPIDFWPDLLAFVATSD